MPVDRATDLRNYCTGVTVTRDLTIGGEEAQGDEQK